MAAKRAMQAIAHATETKHNCHLSTSILISQSVPPPKMEWQSVTVKRLSFHKLCSELVVYYNQQTFKSYYLILFSFREK